MPLRHLPRQPDRDPRLHDPPHPHLIPQHQPHLNGVSPIPTTPVPLPNGPNPIVSPPSAVPAVPNGVSSSSSMIHKLASANEQTWLLIGRVAEQMGDLEHALSAYENALRHNPVSLPGLTQVAGIARIKENYPKAVDYFQRVLNLQEENGEVWSALGHCYLMQDDLQKAYSAYQQALYLLPNPKEDPKLWYGIGILYDRYGSLDHAEEAFSSVLRMDKDFDKANEILFRLGIIYKQQGKYDDSLQCFDRILRNPPSPLAHADIWFQIGHVYEQQKDYVRAKDAYERVVIDNPGHAKVLQQLGWLYHQDGSAFQNQDLAIQYLTKSLEADPSDAQSWYLLGRAYMAGQKYNKAYEAYQQAVYRDGRNPTFWCSIGVLYFQINQFRDALDAYSRAIRINPYISEVWFDLGSLYESCNNQISDAIDAYARASELDPSNHVISQRLQLLKNAQATGGQLPAAPGPQDVHPTAYASAVVPPPGLTGPPLLLQSVGSRPVFRANSRGPSGDRNISLPPPSQVGAGRSSPGPFRGGPPPPVVIDESRHHPSHTPLGPMSVDRPPHHGRDYPIRDGPTRGPAGHQNLLLHHPVPQQQPLPEEIRGGVPHGPVHHQEPYFSRPPLRAPSRSVTPPPSNRTRSPPPPFASYSGSGRQPLGPGQPNPVPSQRSPRSYVPELVRSSDHDAGWERRPLQHADHPREWDRERRPRHSGEYTSQPPPPAQSFYPQPRTPPPHRHSPPDHSPRSGHGPRYWESNSSGGPSGHPVHIRPSSPPPSSHQHEHSPTTSRRYDPRYDAREHRDPGPARREPSREIAVEQRNQGPRYSASPEGSRTVSHNMPGPHVVAGHVRPSESPRPTPAPEPKERRRRGAREKDSDTPPTAAAALSQDPPPPPPPKKERRKRTTNKRAREEQARTGTPKSFAGGSLSGPGSSFKHAYGHGKGSPEPSSSNGSSRSMQPSPTSATPRAPSRIVDEDYDEGVEDALMGLAREASYRAPETATLTADGPPTRSPTVSSGSRHTNPSPRPHASHRESVSSSRSHASSSSQPGSLKRALSQGPDELDVSKRSRLDVIKRRVVSPAPVPVAPIAAPPAGGRRSPLPSTRPSPIPFRTQPTHSPDSRQALETYPPNSPLPAVLPPHPRPIGSGLASNTSMNNNSTSTSNNTSSNSHGGAAVPIALPPIATLSPTSSAPSPTGGMEREERMQSGASRSSSPLSSRAKLSDLIRPSGSTSRSPSGTKHTPSPTSSVRDKMDTS